MSPGSRFGGLGAFAVVAIALLAPAGASALPDGRGYELVSPAERNGAQLEGPETIFGGGDFQAAAQGGALTYTSASSFAGGQGSPGASQYLARRGAGGWSNENLTVTQFSGGYDTSPTAGAPYRLFSADLGSGLLTNGRRCRGEGEACPVPNLALPGSGAPAGFRNYYLRDSANGSFKALLTSSDLAHTTLRSDQFEVSFVAAGADLSRVALSSCAKLTAEATEVVAVPGGECDPAAQNLYLRSAAGLELINLLPGEGQGTPGASIAAQSGAISADGSRVYFTEAPGGALYVREAGGPTKLVPQTVAGGASFQTASADGSLAFFTNAGTLYRYSAEAESSTALASGVSGVLGAAADGSRAYFATATGLFLWAQGTTTQLAASPNATPTVAASDYPPATGTARLSADGNELAFLSAAKLAGFDPKGVVELYLYSSAAGLACVSCNTTATKPLGPAAIPGALANGASFAAYKPRALSDSGNRLFFNSKDALLAADTNGDRDVYQWEAQGTGSCAKAGGCVDLISSGKAEDGASFIDASADGADVFFTTNASLVADDPGNLDLYDARVGGGFPLPLAPIPCVGDDCQPLPGEPEDPTPGTLLQAGGNEPLPHGKAAKKCKKGQVKKNGKCVRKKSHKTRRARVRKTR